MVTQNPLAADYNLKTIDDITQDGITKVLYKDPKKFEGTILKVRKEEKN